MNIILGLLLAVLSFISLMATLIGLPGNWCIIILTVLMAFFTHWQIISITTTVIVVLVLLAGELLETVLAFLGMKKYKPSKWTYIATFLGGIVGGLIGTSMFPLVGSIIGVAIGVFICTYVCESYISPGNVADKVADKVAKRAMIGTLVGISIKFIIAVGVIVYILGQIFFAS